MAAVSETTEREALPSPAPDVDEVAHERPEDVLTEEDLAHLTGVAGPDAADWASPPPPATEDLPADGTDDGVSRAVVVPLIAVAVAAVVFVAYSIVTQSPAQRPDGVALIDRTTTTVAPAPTTTEAATPFDGAVPIGVDIAEQAERMCQGDQFSIARSGEPSTAIYNDVMIAVQDGRSDWAAAPDQTTLRGPVPALVGCLRTADAGEIDRCPTTTAIISRRSVSWSYRVLRTIDGVEVGSAAGTAGEVRPCEELEIEAAGSDYASWSPLPTDQFAAAGGDLTTPPHPQLACATLVAGPPIEPADPVDTGAQFEPTDPESPIEPGLAVHAATYSSPAVDHPLPKGWAASDERPVEAVLCLIPTAELGRVHGSSSEAAPSADESTGASNAEEAEPAIQAPPAGCPITAAAVLRSGEWIGSWEHVAEICPPEGEALVPESWLVEVVGPELGYPLVGE
jgi:hypothetical protein